jgi:hypothetical protein
MERLRRKTTGFQVTVCTQHHSPQNSAVMNKTIYCIPAASHIVASLILTQDSPPNNSTGHCIHTFSFELHRTHGTRTSPPAPGTGPAIPDKGLKTKSSNNYNMQRRETTDPGGHME